MLPCMAERRVRTRHVLIRETTATVLGQIQSKYFYTSIIAMEIRTSSRCDVDIQMALGLAQAFAQIQKTKFN